MSDDEEGRLLIDDHDTSGTQLITAADSMKNFPFNNISVPLPNAVNGIDENPDLEVSDFKDQAIDDVREEGEIDDHADGLSTFQRNEKRSLSSPHYASGSELSVDTTAKIEKGSQSCGNKLIRMSPVHPKVSPGKPRKGIYEEQKQINGMCNATLLSPRHNAHLPGKKHKDLGGEEARAEKKRPNTQRIHEQYINPIKKHKPQPLCRDKGTSVHTLAIQCERDESIFDMEEGTMAMANFTILKKIENSVYVCFRWKEQELYGILTDGQSPTFPNISKKRPALNGSADVDRGTSGGASTPSKIQRDPKRRGGSVLNEKKKPNVSRAGSSCEGNEKEDDDCDQIDGLPRTGEAILIESLDYHSTHLCDVGDCGFRFERGSEMEYHKSTVHAKKKVMYDTRCSQTDIFLTCDRETETGDGLNISMDSIAVQTDVATSSANSESVSDSQFERETVNELMSRARRDTVDTIPLVSGEKNDSRITPNDFSDISDTEEQAAPQLKKEEPSPSPRPTSSLQIHSRPPGSIGQSAFTPTEANTIKTQDEQGIAERKNSSVSLQNAANAPTSFHLANPEEKHPKIFTGKPRALSTPQQAPGMNGSPRPNNIVNPAFLGNPTTVPGFPFMIQPGPSTISQFTSPMHRNSVASPARPNEQHKIHELKSKDQLTSSVNGPSEVPSTSSSVNASPAPKISISTGPPSVNTPSRQPNQFMQMMGQQSTPQQQMQLMAQAHQHAQQQQQQQHYMLQAMMQAMQQQQGRPGMSATLPPGFQVQNPNHSQDAFMQQFPSNPLFGAHGHNMFPK